MKGSRGIAQLLVLWALILLGTLALGFSLSMRTEAQAARNGVDDARAYFLARTGVQRAAVLLATLPADNVMRMEIAEKEGDASYRVRVESESGKLDVNRVADDVLLEVLRNGGLSEEEAEEMRDAILDWRDEDDLPRARGAEASEYAQSGEPVRPRNGKILSVEELRFVRGVTEEFYGEFLSRVFTAHGNSAQVSFLRAREIVLRSLPGVSPEGAARIVERQTEDPPMSPADLAAMVAEGLLSPRGLALISGGQATDVYTITSTGTAGTGVSRTVSCRAEIAGPGKDGIRILWWLDLSTGEVDG